MLKAILTLSMLLMVSACSTSELLKSTEPQQTTYALHPLPARQGQEPGLARVVEIAKPSVPPGFDTDRIALYIDGGRTLDYYSGAKWPDILDSVLQDFMRRSATNIVPYIVAMAPNQANDADFRLQTKINEFQPVYKGSTASAPELIVSVEFTLISLPQEVIVGNFTLSRRSAASQNNLGAIVADMEKMLQDINSEAFERLDLRMSAKKTP
jgi:ABC-type uncharacterized transport system auxiliary subunit